jgi:hypothetical protein
MVNPAINTTFSEAAFMIYGSYIYVHNPEYRYTSGCTCAFMCDRASAYSHVLQMLGRDTE